MERVGDSTILVTARDFFHVMEHNIYSTVGDTERIESYVEIVQEISTILLDALRLAAETTEAMHIALGSSYEEVE